MSKKNKVCVVIPAYNEELHIADCLKSTLTAFPDAFILVVDNNSTDATADIARGFGVTVISEPAKGKGNAVTTGVRVALETGYSWIAFHDSDNEYNAQHLAALVEKCKATAVNCQESAVMGVGLREVSLGHVLWRSLLANYVARAALKFATRNQPPPDILTGARVLNAFLAKKAFTTEDGSAPYTGFELETAITRHALTSPAQLIYSGVSYAPRAVGEKKIKATDMIHILKAAWGY